METKDIRKKRFLSIKTVFRFEWNFLIVTSLFAFVSLLPLAAWYVLKFIIEWSIVQAALEGYVNSLFTYRALFGGVFLLVAPLSYMLVSGVLNLFVKKVLNEHVEYFADYFQGVKAGFKYAIAIGFPMGILYNSLWLLNWISQASTINQIAYLSLLIVSAILIFPVTIIFVLEGLVYHGRLGRLLINAFLLYFYDFPRNILINILSILPIAIIVIFDTVLWIYTIYVLLMVFGFGVIFLFAVNQVIICFDIYVNKENYPELYLKGLPKEDKKDAKGNT